MFRLCSGPPCGRGPPGEHCSEIHPGGPSKRNFIQNMGVTSGRIMFRKPPGKRVTYGRTLFRKPHGGTAGCKIIKNTNRCHAHTGSGKAKHAIKTSAAGIVFQNPPRVGPFRSNIVQNTPLGGSLSDEVSSEKPGGDFKANCVPVPPRFVHVSGSLKSAKQLY